GADSLVPVLPKAAGHDGISRNHSPSGDVAYAAFPNVVSVSEAQCSQRQIPQNNVSSRCRKTLAIWRTPWFLAASGPMGIVTHRVVVTTDDSTRGWGAFCEGRGVNGLWSATESASHINVLELRRVALALRHFLPRLSGQHVLVRADNTSALAYINRQGGVRSTSLHHWANRLLLWAAVHIPGHLN